MLAVPLVALAVGCSSIIASFIPRYATPPYPYYGSFGSSEAITAEATTRQARLTQYISDWLDGKVPATIPATLLPEASAGAGPFTLTTPDKVDPSKIWGERPAHEIDRNASYGNFNDPHAGYLVSWSLVAPFGSKMIMKGTFPQARYFSVQSTPSFLPENYRQGAYGEGEVAWLDADIDPDPGSTNPYRVGADRTATDRNWTITCDLMAGDPKVVDAQAWTAPDFRATGNNRKCSGITFRGPWGDPAWKDGGHEGLFGQGELWVRVYAPDRGTNGWGNMAKPKVYFQLADGREYAIEAAGTQRVAEPLNKRRALNNEGGAEASIDALKTGWAKQFSILRSVQGGLSNGFAINGATPEERAKYVRDLDLGVASKGETARSIGRDEPHATGGTHINYLVNNVCLGAGKVYALAGRLPTTPKTRNGEPTMTAAQARYWSITGYSTAYGLDPNFAYGAEITSVMDDEIVTNASGDYILLYGRAQDRPANATAANGVTWVDWGTESCQAFTIRWVSPGPDWTFAKAPNQTNLGWETEPASASYNPAKIGMNDRNGFLGAYQPVKSYLTKAQWEGLGSSPDPQTLPRP